MHNMHAHVLAYYALFRSTKNLRESGLYLASKLD